MILGAEVATAKIREDHLDDEEHLLKCFGIPMEEKDVNKF